MAEILIASAETLVIDDDVLEKAKVIIKENGMTIEDGIVQFTERAVGEGSFPFDVEDADKIMTLEFKTVQESYEKFCKLCRKEPLLYLTDNGKPTTVVMSYEYFLEHCDSKGIEVES